MSRLVVLGFLVAVAAVGGGGESGGGETAAPEVNRPKEKR